MPNIPWCHDCDRPDGLCVCAPSQPALPPVDGLEVVTDYDAGLLNDYGGGNVDWWWDYLRAEIGRANDHWREALSQASSVIAGLKAERDEAVENGQGWFNVSQERMERIASLEEENKRLREALKPFADAADVFATEYPVMLDKPATSCGIRFDALQSARQALGDHNG